MYIAPTYLHTLPKVGRQANASIGTMRDGKHTAWHEWVEVLLDASTKKEKREKKLCGPDIFTLENTS